MKKSKVTELRETLLRQCDTELQKVHLLQKNEAEEATPRPLITQAVQLAEEHLQRIRKDLAIEQWTLTFIGSVGVGKTTAITHLLGLTDQQAKENGRTKVTSVLKIGAGKTTVCDVVIVFGQTSSVKITDFYSEADFNKLLEEYCHHQQVLSNPNSTLEERKFALPEELAVAVKNLCSLPQEDKWDDYIASALGDKPAEDSTLHYRQLKEAMQKRANYAARQTLHFEPDNTKPLKQWLKETIAQLNAGKFPDAPLPISLQACFEKEILELSLPDYIGTILDTRGTVEEETRNDIFQKLQCSHTLPVICERIDSLGSYAANHAYIRDVYTGNNAIHHKTVYLAVTLTESLLKISDTPDAPGALDECKSQKTQQAEHIWKAGKLSLSPENIHFYDALRGLNKQEEIENMETYQTERNDFFAFLEKRLLNFYRFLESELQAVSNMLVTFQNEQNFPELEKRLHEIQQQLSNSSSFQDADCHLGESLAQKTKESHHSSIRASMKSFGNWRNFHLYNLSAEIGRKDFQEKFNLLFSEIRGKLPTGRNTEPAFAGGELIAKVYLETIKSYQNEKLQAFGTIYQTLCRQKLDPDSEFLTASPVPPMWQKLQDDRGSGYVARCAANIEQMIQQEQVVGAILADSDIRNVLPALQKKLSF